MKSISLILALVLCSGGVYLFVQFVKRLRLRLAMARWPRIRGIVREHRIHSHRNRHGAGHHRPIVLVECSSEGRKWLLHCDSPTRLGFATEEAARSSIKNAAIGESVAVYVDPANARRAFLWRPEIPALLLQALGSLFLLAVSAGILNGFLA